MEILHFLKLNHFLPQTFYDLRQSMGNYFFAGKSQTPNLRASKIILSPGSTAGQGGGWGGCSAWRVSFTKDVKRALGEVKNLLIEHSTFKSTEEIHVVVIKAFLNSQNQTSKCVHETHKYTFTHTSIHICNTLTHIHIHTCIYS